MFVDLNKKKAIESIDGSYYVMIVLDDFTLFCWVCLLKKFDAASREFEQFLSDVRNYGEVEAVRSGNRGERIGQSLADTCNGHRIRQELTTSGSPQDRGVGDCGLGIIQSTTRVRVVFD